MVPKLSGHISMILCQLILMYPRTLFLRSTSPSWLPQYLSWGPDHCIIIFCQVIQPEINPFPKCQIKRAKTWPSKWSVRCQPQRFQLGELMRICWSEWMGNCPNQTHDENIWKHGNLSSSKPFSLKRIWTHSQILLIFRLALLIFADLLWQNPLFHPSLAAASSSPIRDLVDFARQLFLLVSKPTTLSSNPEVLKQWLQRTCHENTPTSPVTKPTPRRPRLRKSFVALRPCLCFGPLQRQNATTQF